MNKVELSLRFPVINLGATCFANLSDEKLCELEAHKRQITFQKGDIISKQGTFAPSVMFVLDGFVKEFIEGTAGKNTNLRIVGKGDFIALSGLFNNRVSNYSAMALSSVTLCLFDKEYLLKLIQENSDINFRLIHRYSELENSFFSLLHSHLYKQMNGKMARALLYLSSFNRDGINIFQYMSRRDIAEFASISTENAIRVLKIFESDGLIEIKEKKISLLNREALEMIFEKG
ncbi:Crp/Fnr family transcriptional regulator [uncultured Bacteroides sp.]|uniref:Crp/Fnr family transcriptional regulator n=1 Tax=uncultured Bacteroides sp. TaxID=162156 RepID=UPI002AA7FF41|nr:Crp/Fnr family transcriptional regulator [uncultured Bacteroides sp.]